MDKVFGVKPSPGRVDKFIEVPCEDMMESLCLFGNPEGPKMSPYSKFNFSCLYLSASLLALISI